MRQHDSETMVVVVGGVKIFHISSDSVNWWHSPAAHLLGRVWSLLQLWLAPSLELELASWRGASCLPALASRHAPVQSSLRSAATGQTPHAPFAHFTLFAHYWNGLDMLICVTPHKRIQHARTPHPCLFTAAQRAQRFPVNPTLQQWLVFVSSVCMCAHILTRPRGLYCVW